MEKKIVQIAFGVLAGGRSRRMGADKARLMLEGRSFLEIVLDAGAAFCERLVSLSAGAEAETLPGDVRIVRDERADTGPLEGIRQLLSHTKCPACLVAATDLPGLTAALTGAMAARYPGSGNLVLTCGGKNEPLCSIYGRECLPVIEALQAQSLARPALLFDRVPTVYVSLEELGFPAETVRNINQPEEYRTLWRQHAEQNPYLTERVGRRLTESGWEELPVTLVTECVLTILVNGTEVVKLNCSPTEPEELAAGYLRTAGYLRSAGQILMMETDKSGLPDALTVSAQVLVLSESEKEERKPVCWDGAMIWKLCNHVVRDAPRNRASHSTHSCTLMRSGEILCCREDVGRHNAIDRAVGWALREGQPLSECIAFFSGRVSAEAVRKAAAAGIPVLCAKALPTAQAAALAAQTGLILLHCSEKRGILQF